ncbi:MAG: hypothetical protein PUC59_08325 [Firmicutes bacterium]|nr:hypothetical protein [Bacillota bacterium]
MMQKTKLGIGVGLLGAVIYLTCLFSGYLAPILLTGYVLLFEENEWLKKNAVKAIAVLIAFSFLTTAIYLIPNVIGFIDHIFAIFNGSFSISIVSKIVNVIVSAIDILEKLLFIGLAVTALNQKSIPVPVVDQLIDKYM